MVLPPQAPSPRSVAQQQAQPAMPSFPPSAPMMPPHADNGLPAGTVAEVMQVPNYTYLRITTPGGDVWAAVSSNPALAVGQKVALAQASKMEGFASETLNRTFDEIWFGSLAENRNSDRGRKAALEEMRARVLVGPCAKPSAKSRTAVEKREPHRRGVPVIFMPLGLLALVAVGVHAAADSVDDQLTR